MPNFDFQFLTELYKTQKIEKLFFTEKYGKNKKFSHMPEIRVVTEDKGMSISTLGKRGDPNTTINTQKNVTEKIIDPAQIWETDMIDEQTIYTNQNPANIMAKSSKDIKTNADYIRALKLRALKERKNRREEKMLADLIATGKIEYKDSKRSYTSLDFGITKDTQTISTSTKLYEYLISLTDDIRKSGHAPTEIVISPGMETAILNNTQIKDMIKKNEANIGTLQMHTAPNVREVIRLKGLPPIYVYFGEYTDENGTTKPYFPTESGKERISVISASAIQVAYGAFVNFKVNQNGYPVMGEAFSWETIPESGMYKELNLYSRPGHYIRNGKAIASVSVTLG
jgi:hypothetical protein